MQQDLTPDLPHPLSIPAGRALKSLAELVGLSALDGLDANQLIGEKAALLNLQPRLGQSASGTSRLLTGKNGTVAISLSRESDWELVTAWLQREANWNWSAIGLELQEWACAPLIERARMLGIAAAPASGVNPTDLDDCYLKDNSFGHGSVRKDKPRVLDLTSLWAGPLCGHLLQLAGAEVIKVESTARPDGARRGNQQFFAILNQGKKSVALDLGQPDGHKALLDLISQSDIVLEASRPRALRQMGIHAESLLDAHPSLTWVSITGYGREEPEANWVAYGDDSGAAAGLCELMYRAVGSYEFAGDAIADPLTGINAALLAWRSWSQGGKRLVSVPLRNVAAASLAELVSEFGVPVVYTMFQDWWRAYIGGRNPVDIRSVDMPVAGLGEHNDQFLSA